MTIGKSAFDLPGIWTFLKNLKIEVRWFFHWWAEMVSEYGKSLSIRSVMSNLVGKVASFAFVAHLVQEISLFLVFNMALAAILDLKVKIVPKHNALETSLICIPLSASRDVHFYKRMICFLSGLL